MCGCGGSSWSGMNYAPPVNSGAWSTAAPSHDEWEVRIPLRRKVDGVWVRVATPSDGDPTKAYERHTTTTYQEAEALLRQHGVGGAIARIPRSR